MALTLLGGAGNDRLIGSAFNDMHRRRHRARTASPAASASTPSATAPAARRHRRAGREPEPRHGPVRRHLHHRRPARRRRRARRIGPIATGRAGASEDDPSFRSSGAADRWSAGATVENINGHLRAGRADRRRRATTRSSSTPARRTITIGGVARGVPAVATAASRSTTAPADARTEHYMVYLPLGNRATGDHHRDRRRRRDKLVVYGTSQPDTISCSSAGHARPRAAPTTDDDHLQRRRAGDLLRARRRRQDHGQRHARRR